MENTGKIRNYIYYISLFFITLSGFAQMPVFKRYYIADIPGLGWLAEFYITHSIHYIFAVILTGFVTYTVVDFFMGKVNSGKTPRALYAKAVIISGLIITGSLMMVKNFSGTPFSHVFIIFLDLSHLGLCMALLFMTALEFIKVIKGRASN